MKLINRGDNSAPNMNLDKIWCTVDGVSIPAKRKWPHGQIREFSDDDALHVVAICGPAFKLVDEPKAETPSKRTRKKKEEPTAEAADVAPEAPDNDPS